MLKRYSRYKNSGVEWIGDIPEDWGISKVKYVLSFQKNKSSDPNPVVLSLARSGVRVRDISTNEGQIAESYINYNVVKIGDLLINPMDLRSGANCSYSNVEGVISPAYFNLGALNRTSTKYYDYFFKIQYWIMAFFAHGKGVSFENRWTLNNETLKNYLLPFPPLPIQQQIADYLDQKTQTLDQLITAKKSQAEKLKEYRKALISETVTKGLDKNVSFKNSGVEWIGDIPEDWEVKKLKYLATIKNGKDFKSVVEGNGKYPVMGSGGEFARTDSFIYDKPSVLLGRKGTINKPLYIEDPFWTVDTMYYTEISIETSSKYFFYLTNTINFDLYKYGSTLPSMAQKDLNNIYFATPYNNEKQQQIADYLDQKTGLIDLTIKKIESQVEKMQEYRKCLISEVVTGKIKVA